MSQAIITTLASLKDYQPISNATSAMNEQDRERSRINADRRGERLNRWRAKEPGLTEAFKTELQQFKKRDPVTFESFFSHMENAFLATCTALRAHDIMLWFPNLPDEVYAALMDLCEFYHGEGRQMAELYRTERLSGSWANEEWDIDQEIHDANLTTKTTVKHGSLEVISFQTLGTQEQAFHLSLLFRLGAFDDESRIFEETARALAICKVTRMWFDSNTALRQPGDGRWEEARMLFLVICEGYSAALDRLASRINKPGVSLERKQFYMNTAREIKRIEKEVESGDRFAKIARGRKLASDYEMGHKLVVAGRKAEEMDPPAPSKATLEDMAAELRELEDGPNGIGRVLGKWRDLKID